MSERNRHALNMARGCERLGLEVEYGGKHYKVRMPPGKGIVAIPKTPSDSRSLYNVRATLQRMGDIRFQKLNPVGFGHAEAREKRSEAMPSKLTITATAFKTGEQIEYQVCEAGVRRLNAALLPGWRERIHCKPGGSSPVAPATSFRDTHRAQQLKSKSGYVPVSWIIMNEKPGSRGVRYYPKDRDKLNLRVQNLRRKQVSYPYSGEASSRTADDKPEAPVAARSNGVERVEADGSVTPFGVALFKEMREVCVARFEDGTEFVETTESGLRAKVAEKLMEDM